MKKLILASIMLLLILAGCSSKDAGVTFIDITQLDEKISNNEDFVVILGQDTCKACLAYKPTLEEVVKNKDVEIYYVQIVSTWSIASKQAVIDYFEEDLGQTVQGTPTTYFIKNGVVEDSVLGEQQYLTILGLLETKGYVQ